MVPGIGVAEGKGAVAADIPGFQAIAAGGPVKEGLLAGHKGRSGGQVEEITAGVFQGDHQGVVVYCLDAQGIRGHLPLQDGLSILDDGEGIRVGAAGGGVYRPLPGKDKIRSGQGGGVRGRGGFPVLGDNGFAPLGVLPQVEGIGEAVAADLPAFRCPGIGLVVFVQAHQPFIEGFYRYPGGKTVGNLGVQSGGVLSQVEEDLLVGIGRAAFPKTAGQGKQHQAAQGCGEKSFIKRRESSQQ